jgi:hypothetical protein
MVETSMESRKFAAHSSGNANPAHLRVVEEVIGIVPFKLPALLSLASALAAATGALKPASAGWPGSVDGFCRADQVGTCVSPSFGQAALFAAVSSE